MVEGITQEKNVWIITDPRTARPRSGPMLTNAALAHHVILTAPPLRRKDNKVLTLVPDQISPQTVQMLAVRDQRDREAFSALFDYFAPRLKGFVMRKGTSGTQAEEIVQDVMLTVWRKADQFDPHRAQVSAWVYQIARNRHIDVIRKERQPVPEEMAYQTETEPDASQIMAIDQETGQLRQAIRSLSPDQRAMVEKAYLGEMTHHEISAQTGLPLGTIKSRIRLGLERLRHELKGMR